MEYQLCILCFFLFLFFILFITFLNVIGCRNIVIELVVLVFYAICYTLEALVRWFVPRRRKKIDGLTAVVTGAGHGIGKLIATGLAKKGVKAVLLDIDKQSIDSVAQDIIKQKRHAFSFRCDVTKKEEVYETARKIIREVGDVDILVNNAGVVSGQKFLHCSDDDITRTMDVNVMANFWTLRAFLGPMMQRNRGNIVAIASVMGMFGSPSLVDYCCSKSAVIGMMDALRHEVISEHKNRVFLTTVLPSKVDTGMFDGAKGRFNFFPPTIQPEYVARKVIDAIQRNEIFVVLPAWLSLVFVLKSFMPQKLLDAILEFFGLSESMNEFIGHGKKKKS